MGNDIFLAFINKKKNMTLEYANTFFKYTVNNKNKINKTLSNIIELYIELFYLQENEDFSDVDKYFSLQNSKDKLLKEVIASTIKFYQVNNIEDKINGDKATIIIISNVVYLSLSLSERCFKNYNGTAEIIVEQFLNKYSSKIRIKDTTSSEEMKIALTSFVKKDMNSIKKAFKLFETTNYSLDIKRLMDYDSKYLVELNYDIKLLKKYNKKEIRSVLDKGINLDHSIIMIEQILLKIVYDFFISNIDNQYFIKLPIEIFEKQKYKKLIDEMFKIDKLKEMIVLVFKHDDVLESIDTLEQLKNSKFNLGITNVNSLKIKKSSFDNFDFVFASQSFLDMHEGYQEIWSAKGIKFIIS